MVKYMLVIHGSRQSAVVKELVKTFGETTDLDINRERFPLDKLYCYIYINADMTGVQFVAHNRPLAPEPDLILTTISDIATIPLMHNAILASINS